MRYKPHKKLTLHKLCSSLTMEETSENFFGMNLKKNDHAINVALLNVFTTE